MGFVRCLKRSARIFVASRAKAPCMNEFRSAFSSRRPRFSSRCSLKGSFHPCKEFGNGLDGRSQKRRCARWRTGSADPGAPQVFRLFGYADGTGKTTLARHIAGDVEGEVQFGADTGKSGAGSCEQTGCGEARTSIRYDLSAQDMDTEEPSFVLNEDSPASKASLIVIDECSMVDEDLGRDLLSFGK